MKKISIFILGSNVSYRPNFGITFNAAAGEATFDLAPLAISIEI